jgi:hypothetical protein
MVVHDYNLKYLGSGGRRIEISRLVQENYLDFISKRKENGLRYASSGTYLPSICEILKYRIRGICYRK